MENVQLHKKYKEKLKEKFDFYTWHRRFRFDGCSIAFRNTSLAIIVDLEIFTSCKLP